MSRQALCAPARALRHRATDAERALWRLLRNRQLEGLKFRRQQPIGRFIVDFACLEQKLVIELDGGQHQRVRSADRQRDEHLGADGYRVLRFWNHDVLARPQAVADAILSAIDTPHLHPLPQGERRLVRNRQRVVD